jgi:hypothetical protein
MLVVRTSEYTAYPIRKLIGSEQLLWLDHLALAVYPLGLYGVEPRALLRKEAAHDPHPSFASALLDPAVVLTQSAPDLFGDVPTGVVPGEEQDLPAKAFEPLGAPPKELGRYIAHGPAIDESQLRIADLWQIESGVRRDRGLPRGGSYRLGGGIPAVRRRRGVLGRRGVPRAR